MVRSFEVKAYNQCLLRVITSVLNEKLIELQQDGWKIISVFNIPYKEYEPREGYFDSVQFAIIAEHE